MIFNWYGHSEGVRWGPFDDSSWNDPKVEKVFHSFVESLLELTCVVFLFSVHLSRRVEDTISAQQTLDNLKELTDNITRLSEVVKTTTAAALTTAALRPAMEGLSCLVCKGTKLHGMDMADAFSVIKSAKQKCDSWCVNW